jgi:hypothetical protein
MATSLRKRRLAARAADRKIAITTSPKPPKSAGEVDARRPEPRSGQKMSEPVGLAMKIY